MTEPNKTGFRPDSGHDDQEGDINLIEIAITLARYKKLIFGGSLVFGMLIALFTLLLPNIYMATTQILPPTQQSSMAAAMLSQLGALGGMMGVGGTGGQSDTYVAILQSRTLRDAMVQRFRLNEVYPATLQSDLRKSLAAATTIKTDKEGIIAISVEDKSPERAAILANGYVEELQRMTQVLAITEASQRRLFFEKQVQAAKQQLGEAEVALKRLQEKTGIIELTAQADAVVRSASEIKAQIAMKEVELGALRTFATRDNPDYIRTRQVIASLRAQLDKMEAGSVPKGQIPEAGLEYMRKLRDLKYAETVFEVLSKQFEMAKIDEAKNNSVIQVLDKAVIPDQKASPHRAIITIFAMAISAVILGIAVFLFEGIQTLSKDSQSKEAIRKLKEYLRW